MRSARAAGSGVGSPNSLLKSWRSSPTISASAISALRTKGSRESLIELPFLWIGSTPEGRGARVTSSLFFLMSFSTKLLPHVDERELALGPSVVLDVSNLRVKLQILSHLLVRVELNGIESGTPRRGFRKLK
jgi:hypothetical protein